MKRLLGMIGVTVLNGLLLVGLTINLSKLIVGHRQHADMIARLEANPEQILAANPEQFLAGLRASGIPDWAWVVNIGGIVVTAILIVGLWTAKKSATTKVFWWTGLIWWLLWVGYLVTILALVVQSLGDFV